MLLLNLDTNYYKKAKRELDNFTIEFGSDIRTIELIQERTKEIIVELFSELSEVNNMLNINN